MFLPFIYLGMGFVKGLDFSDAISPLMGLISEFHSYCLIVGMFVVSIILFGLVGSLKFKGIFLNFSENKKVELFWTCFPALILIVLAIPSLYLLYGADSEHVQNNSTWGSKTIKVTGHQWYWSFSFYNKDNFFNYDSYMVSNFDNPGEFRLLEVDNPLFLSLKKFYSFLVTSEDVLHSFCMPSVGVKIDCVPGRLNSQSTLFSLNGVFYGQCSEICGVNHSFMPVSVEVI